MKKNFLVSGFRVFVSDVTSDVGFWQFWLMLPGLVPNRYAEEFRSSFHWKLSWNPILLSL